MKESQISDALRESMNAVRLSPALRAKALANGYTNEYELGGFVRH